MASSSDRSISDCQPRQDCLGQSVGALVEWYKGLRICGGRRGLKQRQRLEERQQCESWIVCDGVQVVDKVHRLNKYAAGTKARMAVYDFKTLHMHPTQRSGRPPMAQADPSKSSTKRQ